MTIYKKLALNKCDCTDNNDVGTNDILIVQQLLHVCGHGIARVSGHGLIQSPFCDQISIFQSHLHAFVYGT